MVLTIIRMFAKAFRMTQKKNMKLTPSKNKSLATLCSKQATSLTVITVEGFLSSLLTESVRHLRIWFQKHKKSWMHAENRERASEPHDD